MIIDDYTYKYYIKVPSINLFKQSQVFRYTLYLHDVQKLASQFLTVHFQIKSLGLICTVAK